MANRALTDECKNHMRFKEVVEDINIFCRLKGYQFYITTEEARDGYIPDVCFYEVGTNRLLGVLEVVNFNRLCHNKVGTYRNLNIFLWYADILPWTQRFEGIDFSLWESMFSIYFKKALEGVENADLIRVASEANPKRRAFFDGVQVHLVRYDVKVCNEKYGFYSVVGYDISGKSYHMIIAGDEKEAFLRNKKKKITDYRLGTEPLYEVFSNHKCWADALNVPKHLTQLV